MNDLLLPIVTVLLGGGFIGGFVLLLKLRPEAGEITVRSAEKVVLIQDNLIEDLRTLIKDSEARCAKRIRLLEQELSKRPTRDELLDANGRLKRQLLAEGITPTNGPE